MTTILNNNFVSAEIKSLGAELISLKNNTNTEYLWEGNPQFWGKHSPVLFPIVGALKNDTYQCDSIEYNLSRHGFAREMEFELIEKTDSKAVFSIQSTKNTLLKYPFEFELQIIYTLEAKSLTITYKVINRNDVKMPFSIGAHPALALPNNFENYSIQFSEKETLNYHLLENNLIAETTKELPLSKQNTVGLNYQLFANDALIFKTIQSKTLSILENNNPIIRVHYTDFPSLGIWTVPDAPFVCIEPWLGYADTVDCTGNIFEKEGILILDPKHTFKSQFTIEIV
ncbi:aldose 1-epimerase family protein [Flavobacterium faecale]|uniref:aldose 1-epimerase family protein n=1 Tax=Flavobacterium faecale TaxID=1355330 RepID=UPI003AB0F707